MSRQVSRMVQVVILFGLAFMFAMWGWNSLKGNRTQNHIQEELNKFPHLKDMKAVKGSEGINVQ